ncbi:MAG: endonuclease MutS2 [Candidatus Heteroscillospira sp.]
MDFYEKSVSILELPAVLEMLANEASCESAKESCRALRPSAERSEVRRRLGQTSAAKDMMVVKGSPSFSGVKDVRSSLARADMGGMLNTRELLDIAGVLRCARTVRAYGEGKSSSRTDIDYLFASLQANKFLEEKITGSILGEDEIADSASSELATIRRQMRAASARVRDTLQKIISSPGYSKALQEAIITQRSERYVVPVKAEYRSAIPGLVHDVSASGATLFVEPMGVVKANNELRELRAREKTEIERILMELSADCAGHRDDITCDFTVLVELDSVFARAKLSYKLNCGEAVLSDGNLRLKKARHPLLDQTKAVPIDIELGKEFDTLIITGPNTGGKTVTLKTLGLFAVMNQCGLHIPAADGSELPIFRRVLADIGDEQSIEQSLSTFSSHMTNIVRVLEECDAGTLLLFDELGAGTDPTEGAALAIAVIEYARKSGAMVAATTHYAELKVYATTTKGVQNASCEFDVETLRPTYKLLIGIPGKSNAFAISRRLGLSDHIIDEAKKLINADSMNFEDTLEQLERMRQQLERDQDEARIKLRQAEENLRRTEQAKREVEVRLEMSNERARREAESILTDARRTVEQAFDEIDAMRRAASEAADHQAQNEARAEMRRRLNEAEEKYAQKRVSQEPVKNERDIRAGDTVEIVSMGVKAEVMDVAADGSLTLQAGIMRVSVKQNEVRLLEQSGKKETRRAVQSHQASLRTVTVPSEIDVRGMMTDEAVPVVERYIDSAVLGKLNTVTIIHGKGTGALRAAIGQSLKRNKQVKSFRPGRFGEGEMGVTVVELK